MQVIGSVSNKLISPFRRPQPMGARRHLGLWLLALVLGGCTTTEPAAVRDIPIQQDWQLEPGAVIGDHRIAGGLGDISIEIRGDRLYAPFDGELQPNTIDGCYVFSSPDVPAYLFRLCGLDRPRLGPVSQGTVLGSANFLGFATLRRQPDGHWTMVEPASDVLQRMLDPEAVQVGGSEH